MLEEYILTGDGKEYVDVNCVREALGIGKDSESNIFKWIAFLKKSNERSHSEMYEARGEKHEFEKKIREALGIVDEYADLIELVGKLKEERDELKDNLRITENALKTVKKERDELKEKYDKLKKRTNAAYGDSCGYCLDDTPVFKTASFVNCSFTYTGGKNTEIEATFTLYPNANYKGEFDTQNFANYITHYDGRKVPRRGWTELEKVDYQNAKAARAELAYLYKQVLGKEKLDRDLSPHEVMKAIHDEYKRVRDSQFAFSQSLRSVYMDIYEGTGYDISDIYAAPDKIAEWIITRYDSTKTLGHMETVCNINDLIDELCDKYNVVQPARSKTTRERIEYIFSALTDYRNMADSNFNKAVEFRKEKQAVENVLAELRAKVREIYCSVVNDEWDEYLAYTSALNDINEEYKRVVQNFEKLKKTPNQDAFRYAICSALDMPTTVIDGNIIGRIHLMQDRCDKLARLRSNICTALCLGSETSDEDILKAIAEDSKESNRLTVFRNDVAKAIGLPYIDINSDIINRVVDIKEHHDKLCEDYTELRKAIWEAMGKKTETQPGDNESLVGEVQTLVYGDKWLREFRDSVAKAIGMDYPTTNTFIVKQVQQTRESYEKLQKDYDNLGKAYSAVLKWNNTYAEVRRLLGVSADADAETMIAAVKLLRDKDPMDIQKQNDDLIAGYNKLMSYKIQIEKELHKKDLKLSDSERRRKMWMVRYESEHKRANGEHRRAEGCFNDIAALKTQVSHLMRERDAMVNEEVGLQSLKNAVRKLQNEKNRVIEALGQDIWDDAVK